MKNPKVRWIVIVGDTKPGGPSTDKKHVRYNRPPFSTKKEAEKFAKEQTETSHWICYAKKYNPRTDAL